MNNPQTVSRETNRETDTDLNTTLDTSLDTRRGRYSSEGMAMVVLGKWNLSRLDSKAQEEGLSRSAMLRQIIEEHFDK